MSGAVAMRRRPFLSRVKPQVNASEVCTSKWAIYTQVFQGSITGDDELSANDSLVFTEVCFVTLGEKR